MTEREAAGPAARRLALHLEPRAERAVRRGHPWVYAEGIRRQRSEGTTGDLAVLFDRDDRFLAIGLYDPASPIRVRVLQHGTPATIDAAWIAGRIAEAWQLREPLLAQDTTGFRVVHGENDGLPGLIVDRYGDSAVVKLYTAAWVPYLPAVVAALQSVFRPVRTVLRLSRAVARAGPALRGLSEGTTLHGSPPDGPVLFHEFGVTFESDLLHGQKTGFFLDQRDNRARVERLSAGRSVLNVFAYTGGFSLFAARGGATAIDSLDISRPALAAAERNFGHNRSDPRIAAATHRTVQGDAFAVLAGVAERGARYGMVVLDPPAFAKSRAEVDVALQSYQTLTRLGLNVLAPGGILVAASCSSRVSAQAFADAVATAAAGAGRPLDILEQTGHPLDHPIGFAEGAYLKCIFARA
ncbi:MAG: class I SAM-dependent methyltransferase [Gemmatimonadota bacterium]